jgi:hypothetical protein
MRMQQNYIYSTFSPEFKGNALLGENFFLYQGLRLPTCESENQGYVEAHMFP